MTNDREVLSRIVKILQDVHLALCEPVGHSFDENRLGDELCVIEQYLAAPRPKVVCLCGSTRSNHLFMAATLKETVAGNIVLRPVHLADAQFAIALHYRRIDLADEILVIDADSPHTKQEIAYAQKLGKRIRYWSQET